MSKILVVGAGKSSTWLIKYLLQHAASSKWSVTVADGNAKAISEKIGDSQHAKAAVCDITSKSERQALVKDADIVLSLMPPQLHALLAADCLEFKKNLITSSYLSPEIKEMDAKAKESGLLFMCEMGLDPGIDHMTANHIIHSIQRVACILENFSSYCGGLIAPESDDNPWHYKFSWNPRNVVDAGKSGGTYLLDGTEKHVDYSDIFRNNAQISVDTVGNLAWYANRDSLKYLTTYDIPDATTFLRATLRHPDFCLGWNELVQLGATDSAKGPAESAQTYGDWMGGLSNYSDSSKSLSDHVCSRFPDVERNKLKGMFEGLGLFNGTPLPASRNSHGDILLSLLENKWAMQPDDRDMVVMQHEVAYTHRGRANSLKSSLVVKGETRELSAMAKCVGLPMGILARIILGNRLKMPTGVQIPVMPAVYRPVLNELAHYGIEFFDVQS